MKIPIKRFKYAGPHPIRQRVTYLAFEAAGVVDFLVYLVSFTFFTGSFRGWMMFCSGISEWAEGEE